jgi:putative PIN family toxin of toxin-antitoxin system
MLLPCFSPEIIEEYLDVLLRPKFGFSSYEVEALLAMLQNHGERIDRVSPVRVSPDREDDKFIACAAAGKADFLVTGNKKHFPQTGFKNTRVVSASELLEFITLEL